MKYYVSLFLGLTLFLSDALAQPLKVITTFSVLEDLVREISGPDATVESLIARGKDPHDFSASAKVLQKLKAADAIFIVGFGFEPWFDVVAKSAKLKMAPIQAGANAETVTGFSAPDPHVWLDFENVRRMSLSIESTLVSLRPSKKDEFTKRGLTFRDKLGKLEEGFRKDFTALPANRRVIATSHGGFSYLERTFGIHFISPTFVGHGHELSPRALAAFLKNLEERKLKSYFVVYGHPAVITRDLARDHGLSVAGTLYGDSLGPAGGEAETYLKMQEHNLRAILEHLRKPLQN